MTEEAHTALRVDDAATMRRHTRMT